MANFRLVGSLLKGVTPEADPLAIVHYRVVTPLLVLPFLLLLVWSLLPQSVWSWKNVLIGAVALGCCFSMYFYYWTAASAALCAWIASLMVYAHLRPQSRTGALRSAKCAGIVLAGGLVLGTPQLLANYRVSSNPVYKPILPRMHLGEPVAPDDPMRVINVRNVWVWGKLALGAEAILILHLEGFGLLWWLTLCAYVLSNSALVTGLEYMNYHWILVHAPTGEIMLIGLLARLLDRWMGGRPLLWLWLVPAAVVLIALVWRPFEALRAPSPIWYSKVLGDLRPLRPALGNLGSDCVLAGPWPETDVALIFAPLCGQLYHSFTPLVRHIPDQEVNERHALNFWLLGLGPEEYMERLINGPDTHDPVRLQVTTRWRQRIFDQLADAKISAELLNKLRPNYLLLPSRVTPTPGRGSWRLLEKTPEWALWTNDSK